MKGFEKLKIQFGTEARIQICWSLESQTLNFFIEAYQKLVFSRFLTFFEKSMHSHFKTRGSEAHHSLDFTIVYPSKSSPQSEWWKILSFYSTVWIRSNIIMHLPSIFLRKPTMNTEINTPLEIACPQPLHPQWF